MTEPLGRGHHEHGLQCGHRSPIRKVRNGKESQHRIVKHDGHPRRHAPAGPGRRRRVIAHARERGEQRGRHEKRCRVDGDEYLRRGEREHERTQCGGDQQAGTVQCGIGALHATETRGVGHTRDQRSIARLCYRAEELSECHRHKNRPDDPAVREHDDRGREQALNDGAPCGDAGRPITISECAAGEWPDQPRGHPGDHVHGRADWGLGGSEEEHDQCHRREPVAVGGRTRGDKQTN